MITLQVVYTCSRHNVSTNDDVKDFCKQLEDSDDALVERLDARDAFYGGRTNATKLYVKADINNEEHIDYDDFTSMYPNMNKYRRYIYNS